MAALGLSCCEQQPRRPLGRYLGMRRVLHGSAVRVRRRSSSSVGSKSSSSAERFRLAAFGAKAGHFFQRKSLPWGSRRGLRTRANGGDNVENKDGLKKTTAKCGMNLMRVAHKHGIDLEGACEGVCACSTCHVIMSNEVFDQLPEASEDEEDMLDPAFGLSETSRLGCQVIVTPEMDGIVVKLPAATRNFYVDGHVPQPH